MNKQSVRIATLQVLTMLALALPFIVVATYVWQRHVAAQALLSELEPIYARLQGVRAVQADLQDAVQKSTDTMLKNAYPAGLDATKAGNDAQQRIRTVFETSQLTINSIQVLEAKETQHFQHVSIVLVVEGTLPSMQEALLKLKDQSPVILIDNFAIQSIGAVKPLSQQRISASFNFTVLRARS